MSNRGLYYPFYIYFYCVKNRINFPRSLHNIELLRLSRKNLDYIQRNLFIHLDSLFSKSTWWWPRHNSRKSRKSWPQWIKMQKLLFPSKRFHNVYCSLENMNKTTKENCKLKIDKSYHFVCFLTLTCTARRDHSNWSHSLVRPS